MKKTKVLFVCLGNICRSPTAHGVFQHMVEREGLENVIEVESAGTAAWHIGKKPDERTIQTALKRGYDLSGLRAMQAKESDFDYYDFILAMDESNLSDLQSIQPDTFKGTLELFLNYSEQEKYSEVPDPYYGGGQGFDLVLDLVEDASRGLLDAIKAPESRK